MNLYMNVFIFIVSTVSLNMTAESQRTLEMFKNISKLLLATLLSICSANFALTDNFYIRTIIAYHNCLRRDFFVQSFFFKPKQYV